MNQNDKLSEMNSYSSTRAEEVPWPFDAFLKPWEPQIRSNQFGKTCQHQETQRSSLTGVLSEIRRKWTRLC